ncbi:MAG TPA: carboxypeptidase-like regulatory domain-containing protein [Chryseolinea sp.]|mgnify:CR=1 FL=1|nr:carboxypeptidase-like regulatory domain-containing protein [Chryseolinea sp.]HPM31154.1 carboxypeptidase-like regulatory domain-containing protein [Chryseolinea sp.]
MKKNLLLTVVWLVCISIPGFGQDKVVSGKVTSVEDGMEVPGVNVLVKGTTIGTSTSATGTYTLSIPDGKTTLVFSFIGYKTIEVEIGSRTVVDVSLDSDATQLSEVIVVGYGTQIKQDLTGNIAKVSGDVIQNTPVTSFEQAIQGRAPGVLITSQNGKVGQGINIRIRGSSSISAGNEPLYVVDGMIINSDNFSNTSAATNALADLNTNDIQS